MAEPLALLASAIAVSLSAIGGGYAIAQIGTASTGAIAERPEIFGKTVVYIAFAEAVAIYGLLVALLIILGVGG